MGSSNYPPTFTIETVSPGNVLNITHPKLTHAAIQAAPVAGVRNFVPSKLYGYGEGSAAIECAAGVFEDLDDYAKGMAELDFVMADTDMTSTFEGIITGLEKAPYNAQTPDIIKCTVTVQPTGDVTQTFPSA